MESLIGFNLASVSGALDQSECSIMNFTVRFLRPIVCASSVSRQMCSTKCSTNSRFRSLKNVGAVVYSNSRLRSDPSNNVMKCAHCDRNKTHESANDSTSSFVAMILLTGTVVVIVVILLRVVD